MEKLPFVLLEREGSFVELGEVAAEKYEECLKTDSRANVRLVQGWSHISDSIKVIFELVVYIYCIICIEYFEQKYMIYITYSN